MASLWGGRFEKDMDELVKKYNASIFFDQRMYNEDIDGSIAHVTMLGRQGIVSEEEKEQIIAGLKEIKQEIADGKIVFNVDDEDIHMGVESRLIKKIGDVGKKLHTSRSRNDQCQVDTRLYLRKEIYEILNSLCYLESVILEKTDAGDLVKRIQDTAKDVDAMNVDQELRLTLLEMGISSTDAQAF